MAAGRYVVKPAPNKGMVDVGPIIQEKAVRRARSVLRLSKKL
jgi:hypothetical protein